MSQTSAEALHFQLLGNVELVYGSARVTIRAQRQRTMLAVLLLNANRAVSVDQLIDALWGEDPPATAKAQAQACISALRRLLARYGAAEMLETRDPGYLMQIPPDRLDVAMFDRLVSTARRDFHRGDLGGAVDHLNAALQLWHGPALSGVPERCGAAACAWLDEARLSAQEDLFDVQLKLGMHHELVACLRRHTSENPLRARARAQLMLALHRCGRQPEALQAFRIGRSELVEQLGIEPSLELRELEHAILTNDPDLMLPPAARPLTEAELPLPHSVPRRQHPPINQLPADTACFTGRIALIRRIEQLLDGAQFTAAAAFDDGVGQDLGGSDAGRSGGLSRAGRPAAVPVVILVGAAGVGKSALAVHVAHARYDGTADRPQLYADLAGSSPHGEHPAAVLERFLVGLGIAPDAIPDSGSARAQLYRSLLSERPATVILDDVGPEEAVRLLLPGTAECSVIITSRQVPRSLVDAPVLEVPELSTDESLQMLAGIIGQQRIQAEPEAARTLIDAVDRLPLGIRVIGAKLMTKGHWTLADLCDRIIADPCWLNELTVGELSMRQAMDASFDWLAPQSRRLLIEIDRLPLEDFPDWVAAAVLDIPHSSGVGYLEELVDARLIKAWRGQFGSVRYRLTALSRGYAKTLRAGTSPPDDHAPIARVLSGWLELAQRSYFNLTGHPLEPAGATELIMAVPQEPTSISDPVGWLDREHAAILATVRHGVRAGLVELAADVAVVVAELLSLRAYPQESPPNSERWQSDRGARASSIARG